MSKCAVRNVRSFSLCGDRLYQQLDRIESGTTRRGYPSGSAGLMELRSLTSGDAK